MTNGLNQPNNAEHAEEQGIIASLKNEVANCTKDPHRVIYNIIKSVADRDITVGDMREISEVYLNVFPAMEFLRVLSLEQCKKIIEANPSMEGFESFFLHEVMSDAKVIERIVHTSGEGDIIKQPFNWAALLLNRTGVRQGVKQLLGNLSR